MTPIFWAPSGFSFPASYQSIIDGFLANAAVDSGKPTNVFSSTTQYTDASGNHIKYKLVAGSPIVDTTAYPTSGGCTPDLGAIYQDNTGYSACIDDAEMTAETHSVLSANGLLSDYAHMYLVFLPKSVEDCFTSSNGAQGGQCTINPNVGTAGGYCAYHSGSTASSGGQTIYASMPFPIYSSPIGYTCSPEFGPGIQDPNADVNADVEISPLSHEMSEAITDPLGNAWYDSSGYENGDECAYIYGGGFGGPAGAQYNQTIGSGHYFVQEEFSNEDFATNSANSCIQQEETPTAAFSVPSGTLQTGSPVAFDGTTSSDPDDGGGIASYSWMFGDGSALGSGSTPSHSYSSAGTFTVALTVTDLDGWQATVSHPVTITPAATVTLSVSKSGAGSGLITSQPAGISCGATCSTSVTMGTSLTLAESPASGSTFAGWGGACSGSATTCVLSSVTSNTSATANFALAGLPDLIVTAVHWSPANPVAGNAVTFSATIKNQGAVATPGGVKLGVGFRVDGVQTNYSDTDYASLAAGATVILTADGGPTGSATWLATRGRHSVLVYADGLNLIAESNENNNTLTAPLTIFSNVAPSSVAITSGTYRAGSAASLLKADGVNYQVNSTAGSTRTSTWNGTLDNVPDTTVGLQVTYQGSSSTSAAQSLYIWNYATNAWVLLKSTKVTRTPSTVTVAPTGTLANYVSGTTGNGSVKIEVKTTSPTAAFFSSGDLLAVGYL